MSYLQRKKEEITVWLQNLLNSKSFSAVTAILVPLCIGKLASTVQNYLESEQFQNLCRVIQKYVESEEFQKAISSFQEFLYGAGSEVVLHFIDKVLQKWGVPEPCRTILKWILDIASAFCIAWWFSKLTLAFVGFFFVKKLVTIFLTGNAKRLIDWVFR